jgi:DNA-binding MarR family transcriptional regulator
MNVSYFRVNHLINDAYGLLQRCTHEGLEGFDLSVGQFRLLETLVSGRACSPAQCSRAINLTPAGLTHILDKLETLGLIIRVREGCDRRFITIKLLPAGEAIYQRAAQSVSAAWEAALQTSAGDEVRWLNRAIQLCEPASENDFL